MSKGVFTDKSHKPTENEIFNALETKKILWTKLLDFIKMHYRSNGEYAFYGKNYSWAFRFKKSGKALISLYPNDNCFFN